MGLFTLLVSTLLLAASSSSSSSSSTDLTTLIYKACGNQFSPTPTESYTETLNALFETLVSQSSFTNFNSTTVREYPQFAITGLFQCRGDLSAADCNTCVEKLPDAVRGACSGGTISARAQLAGCYMRFEVAGFQQVNETAVLYRNCGPSTQASGAGFETLLSNAFGEALRGLEGGGNGFFSGSYQGINVLAQCECSLNIGNCSNCVRFAVENTVGVCAGAISGYLYLQSCYIIYTTTNYPNAIPSSPGSPGTEGVKIEINSWRVVAITVGGIGGTVTLTFSFKVIIEFVYKHKHRHKC